MQKVVFVFHKKNYMKSYLTFPYEAFPTNMNLILQCSLVCEKNDSISKIGNLFEKDICRFIFWFSILHLLMYLLLLFILFLKLEYATMTSCSQISRFIYSKYLKIYPLS